MTTIDIKKTTKDKLMQLIDGEEINTMDQAVNRLLDESEISEIDISRTNIHLKEDTFKRLIEYKGYPTESHNDTLARLLAEHQKK